jgi:predicted transport protein
MNIIVNEQKLSQYKYAFEEEFEKDIVAVSKALFGEKAVYIDYKKKISGNALGASVPDGFLIDFSDENAPDFYIVEVELAKHDFYKHIFPQITKFFAFFSSSQSRGDLLDKIYTIIENDTSVKNEIQKLCPGKEIYKLLKDSIDLKQNILLVIDENKPEFAEIFNTYKEWESTVKLEIIKKFKNAGNVVYTMEPEFDEIEFFMDEEIEKLDKNAGIDTAGIDASGNNTSRKEEDHLNGIKESIREIYTKLKSELLALNNSLLFNPQKYYISIRNPKNIVFIKIRQKKIRLIIMLEPGIIYENIRKNTVKDLSQAVQDFYNGPCAAVDIDTIDNLDEIIELLKKLL